VVYGLLGSSIQSYEPETLDLWIEQSGATFPVMVDDDDTYRDYDKNGATSPYPLDVIVDQAGVVRYIATHYDPDAMAEVIDGLL